MLSVSRPPQVDRIVVQERREPLTVVGAFRKAIRVFDQVAFASDVAATRLPRLEDGLCSHAKADESIVTQLPRQILSVCGQRRRLRWVVLPAFDPRQRAKREHSLARWLRGCSDSMLQATNAFLPAPLNEPV